MFWLATSTDASASAQPLGRYLYNLNHDLATRAYNTQGVARTNESMYANLINEGLRTADNDMQRACVMWDSPASGSRTHTSPMHCDGEA
jgi:hypothetical protein